MFSSLKSKILVILVVIVATYVALDFCVQHWIVYPNFVLLEREEAIKSMERTLEAFRREEAQLTAWCRDWSRRDDVCTFVRSGGRAGISNVQVASFFSENQIEGLQIYDSAGQLLLGRVVDSTGKETMLKQFPPPGVASSHPLWSKGKAGKPGVGVLPTDLGLMLVVSHPIVCADGKVAGCLMVARFLDDAMARDLERQTRCQSDFVPLHNPPTVAESQILSSLNGDTTFAFGEKRGDVLHVFAAVSDISGRPAALLRVDVPRVITAQGRFAMFSALVSVLVIGLLILLAMVFFLQRTVVGPLVNLTRHARGIREGNDLSVQLEVRSRDEFGILANEFNKLMRDLSDASRKLLDRSFQSGMAEMAGGILHNLRNDLSPMIMNLDLLRSDLRNAQIDRIRLAQLELMMPELDDEKKRDLLLFLDLAVGALIDRVNDMNRKLDEVSKWAIRIEQVLGDQARFGQAGQPLERVTLGGLLEEGMRMVESKNDGISYEVSPAIAELPSFVGPRIALVRILANLLSNASSAIDQASAAKGRVQIDAAIEPVHGQEAIHLQVRDNGCGIQASSIERIFEREYRPHDQNGSGVGLHWCSNAIGAVGGRIFAESEGAGMGACFHLLIPTRPPIID